MAGRPSTAGSAAFGCVAGGGGGSPSVGGAKISFEGGNWFEPSDPPAGGGGNIPSAAGIGLPRFDAGGRNRLGRQGRAGLNRAVEAGRRCDRRVAVLRVVPLGMRKDVADAIVPLLNLFRLQVGVGRPGAFGQPHAVV